MNANIIYSYCSERRRSVIQFHCEDLLVYPVHIGYMKGRYFLVYFYTFLIGIHI